MRYKVDVRFSGTATVEIEASSPTQAREQALAMTLADLAKSGGPDIRHFELATRDITAMASDGSDTEEGGENRPRPSGWYRPA